MKQFNFSNLIAIVAILLCFYAFSNENRQNVSAPAGEKEYCILRYCSAKQAGAGLFLIGPGGKYEALDAVKEDYTGLKQVYAKIEILQSQGWELKTNSFSSYLGNTALVDQYVFERSK